MVVQTLSLQYNFYNLQIDIRKYFLHTIEIYYHQLIFKTAFKKDVINSINQIPGIHLISKGSILFCKHSVHMCVFPACNVNWFWYTTDVNTRIYKICRTDKLVTARFLTSNGNVLCFLLLSLWKLSFVIGWLLLFVLFRLCCRRSFIFFLCCDLAFITKQWVPILDL